MKLIGDLCWGVEVVIGWVDCFVCFLCVFGFVGVELWFVGYVFGFV